MITINQLKNYRSDYYKYLFIVCLLAVTLLSILPDDAERGYEMPHLTESGFFMHVLAYLFTALLGLLAFRSKQRLAIFLISYSTALEWLQKYLPYRTFNFRDIAANLTGIFLLYAMSTLFSRKYQFQCSKDNGLI